MEKSITLGLSPLEAGWLMDAMIGIMFRGRQVTDDATRDDTHARAIEAKLTTAIAMFAIPRH